MVYLVKLIVKSMVQNILNSNADIVVIMHCGFVVVPLIIAGLVMEMGVRRFHVEVQALAH